TRLFLAIFFGFIVSLIYRWTRGRSADARFVSTLVLLTLLLSVTTIVIGDNIARAFSIVGALSIVRFRTVVEDTRDTAFVICAVAIGLAVGAGYIALPAMALPFIAAAAKLFGSGTPAFYALEGGAFRLNIRVAPDFAARESLMRELDALCPVKTLRGIESVRGGTAIERSYEVELAGENAADQLIARLSAIEGIIAVEVVRTVK
ncbi:MAG: DUF4956 domain-containing protein, partial [Limnohabitans sp.]|nr:DUF4956 domain-containing protein [Limnohabitans sp.]